jgi:hypothetical protein
MLLQPQNDQPCTKHGGSLWFLHITHNLLGVEFNDKSKEIPCNGLKWPFIENYHSIANQNV